MYMPKAQREGKYGIYLRAEVSMLAEVGYRAYGPTYRATYYILYGECATGKPF